MNCTKGRNRDRCHRFGSTTGITRSIRLGSLRCMLSADMCPSTCSCNKDVGLIFGAIVLVSVRSRHNSRLHHSPATDLTCVAQSANTTTGRKSRVRPLGMWEGEGAGCACYLTRGYRTSLPLLSSYRLN